MESCTYSTPYYLLVSKSYCMKCPYILLLGSGFLDDNREGKKEDKSLRISQQQN